MNRKNTLEAFHVIRSERINMHCHNFVHYSQDKKNLYQSGAQHAPPRHTRNYIQGRRPRTTSPVLLRRHQRAHTNQPHDSKSHDKTARKEEEGGAGRLTSRGGIGRSR
jgi:hypothetical protein